MGGREQAERRTGSFHVRSHGSDGGQVAEVRFEIRNFFVVGQITLTEKHERDLAKSTFQPFACGQECALLMPIPEVR